MMMENNRLEKSWCEKICLAEMAIFRARRKLVVKSRFGCCLWKKFKEEMEARVNMLGNITESAGCLLLSSELIWKRWVQRRLEWCLRPKEIRSNGER